MKLEDLTGDDRTLVVVALRALSGSEVTHIMQTAPPASLQARNHQLRIFFGVEESISAIRRMGALPQR